MNNVFRYENEVGISFLQQSRGYSIFFYPELISKNQDFNKLDTFIKDFCKQSNFFSCCFGNKRLTFNITEGKKTEAYIVNPKTASNLIIKIKEFQKKMDAFKFARSYPKPPLEPMYVETPTVKRIMTASPFEMKCTATTWDGKKIAITLHEMTINVFGDDVESQELRKKLFGSSADKIFARYHETIRINAGLNEWRVKETDLYKREVKAYDQKYGQEQISYQKKLIEEIITYIKNN